MYVCTYVCMYIYIYIYIYIYMTVALVMRTLFYRRKRVCLYIYACLCYEITILFSNLVATRAPHNLCFFF